jgi:hypothetical protein
VCLHLIFFKHMCTSCWIVISDMQKTNIPCDITRKFSSGSVVVAKPQLVAIRERVSTNGGNTSVSVTSSSVDGKRVIGAANPGPEDAADLLR